MRENLPALSDEEIMASLESLVRSERLDLVRILRRLAELDRRRAADKRGYPSLFSYCTRKLGFSEGESMRRIQTARAASRFPVIYRLIGTGVLTATAVSYLEPHLTRENYHSLLSRAVGLSTKEVRALAESFVPMKSPPDRVRHVTPLPAPEAIVAGPESPTGDLFDVHPPAEPPRLSYPGEGEVPAPRVQFSFCADAALLREVERAKELLRHKHPFARIEDIFTEAIAVLLEKIDPGRRLIGREEGPRPLRPSDPNSRRIPQAVKDAVWSRDGGCCSFVGPAGRCGARAFLEFDHVVPFALGGASHDPGNIRLLCRAHNQLEARRVLG